jgi:MFS family permease
VFYRFDGVGGISQVCAGGDPAHSGHAAGGDDPHAGEGGGAQRAAGDLKEALVTEHPEPTVTAGERWLTPGVAGVGAASFFSDTGHEITTAVLPSFLAGVLHTGPAALGSIEAASDVLMGVAKLAGGPIADHPGRRARAARGGYLGTALLGGAIGLTVAVWQVILLRAGSWISRGLRSPSRDALLSAIAPATARGRAFGLERAGDNLGAVAGPLLAAALVALIGVRGALLVAAVPGVFAALAISVAARQARTAMAGGGRHRFAFNLRRLKGHGLARAYLPAALFEAGNVATTLLILRATGLLSAGRSATAAASLAILIYAGHNLLAAVASLAAGSIVDRGRPRLVLGVAALVYTSAYAVFAVGSHRWPVLLAGFCLAGTGIGLAETALSAMIAAALPDELRGSGFGLLGLIQAGGDLASTLVVSLLWTAWSATAGFGYAAAWMIACVVAVILTRRPAPTVPPKATG